MSPPPLPVPPASRPEPVALREISQWQRSGALVLIYASVIAVSFYLALTAARRLERNPGAFPFTGKDGDGTLDKTRVWVSSSWVF